MTNVLVTGANRGLGLGFVKNYLGKNVNVVGTTRDLKSSKELLALKERFPDNLEIFELDLLKKNSSPSEDEIREWFEGHICRCTGYKNIIKAVQEAITQ